jgi:hypothetical protein
VHDCFGSQEESKEAEGRVKVANSGSFRHHTN